MSWRCEQQGACVFGCGENAIDDSPIFGRVPQDLSPYDAELDASDTERDDVIAYILSLR
jgi:hypothetical protein